MRQSDKHHRNGKLVGVFLLGIITCVGAQLPLELARGHAHNDYDKSWPALYTALEKGFRSIEVDVYAHRGQLKVAHWPIALGRAPDLESLYFRPLDSLYNAHSPWLSAGTPLILMIDLKGKGRTAQILLDSLCRQYTALFCHFDDSSQYQAPVQLLLSGAYDEAYTPQPHYWQLDGRWQHLKTSSALVPRISQPYRASFSWKGRGEMPMEERALLRLLVEQAHKANKTLRFWGAPNRRALWQVFWEEGVDWIQVDDIEGYTLFIESLENRKIKAGKS